MTVAFVGPSARKLPTSQPCLGALRPSPISSAWHCASPSSNLPGDNSGTTCLSGDQSLGGDPRVYFPFMLFRLGKGVKPEIKKIVIIRVRSSPAIIGPASRLDSAVFCAGFFLLCLSPAPLACAPHPAGSWLFRLPLVSFPGSLRSVSSWRVSAAHFWRSWPFGPFPCLVSRLLFGLSGYSVGVPFVFLILDYIIPYNHLFVKCFFRFGRNWLYLLRFLAETHGVKKGLIRP